MEPSWDDGSDPIPTESLITGKELERYFELRDGLFRFSELFNPDDEGDRAIAIVGATFLETILEHILRAFLIDEEKAVDKLFEYNQPLGNFSGKISMAYCLGLIYKPVRQDLDLVRKIRNEFAHDLYASFNDDKIKKWCSDLQWHRTSYVADPPTDAPPRSLFQVGTNQLVCTLNGVVSIARRRKRAAPKHF